MSAYSVSHAIILSKCDSTLPHARRRGGNLFYIILMLISWGINSALGSNIFAASTSKTSFVSVLSFVIGVVYTLGFWMARNGQTPGKTAMKIRVVKVGDRPLDLFTCIIRYASYYVSILTFGLGFIWVAFDRKKQGWHDKIAGTLVVKTEKNTSKLPVFLGILSGFVFFSIFFVIGFIQGWEKKAYNRKFNQSYKQFEKAAREMNPQARKHFDKAELLFKEVHAANSKNDVAQIRKLIPEIIAELKEASKIEPTNPKIWVELGSAYTWAGSEAEGGLEAALVAFQNAEKFDPSNVVLINNVGNIYNRLGRYEEAVIQYQKTLRLADDSGYAYLGIGIAYKNLKIYDLAKQHLQKAVAVFEGENKDGGFDKDILYARKELAEIINK